MHGPAYQTNQDITAYPNDTLTLKYGDDNEKTYRMYSTVWIRPLDYLLYRYLTLVLHDKNHSEEIKLSELHGRVGLFDDLRPPVSDLKSKANAEKFESLIRAVGDHK